mgnify:CR=1 FL=1
MALFGELGMHDKERLFAYRRSSKVNIYSIGNYKDYYYGYMVPNTSYLKYFELKLYEGGFVLLFPNENTRETAEFLPPGKLFHVLKESAEWGEMLDIGSIGAKTGFLNRPRFPHQTNHFLPQPVNICFVCRFSLQLAIISLADGMFHPHRNLFPIFFSQAVLILSLLPFIPQSMKNGGDYEKISI